MQCPNDKHNFIQADVYTGGTLYRCDKCGLEAHAPMFSGMIFYEDLCRDDIDVRWEEQMRKEMYERIKALPQGAHPSEETAIYDEYAEKRKLYFEKKRTENAN